MYSRLTRVWWPRTPKYFKIDGCIGEYYNQQGNCIHHQHTKDWVKNFPRIVVKEVISDTLLVPCDVWMPFHMKNDGLEGTIKVIYIALLINWSMAELQNERWHGNLKYLWNTANNWACPCDGNHNFAPAFIYAQRLQDCIISEKLIKTKFQTENRNF